MNAICLVIDRLHWGYLGAYGNSWIATPAIDRLAGEGFVFDRAMVDSPRLESLYRSYWQGTHALAPSASPGPDQSLAALLDAGRIATHLVTDDPQIARHPLAAAFDEVVELDPPRHADPVARIDQSHLGRCFAQLIGHVKRLTGPFCLWCHLTGMAAPWDAPYQFRTAYLDADDPEPSRSAAVPNEMLADGFNPDKLFGITQAYAGQVALMDECLGALLDFLDTHATGQGTLLALLSARGFPLGEHRRLGPCDEAIYGELVHVPMIFRFPDALGAASRSQALVNPSDLWATLLDWWQVPDRPSSPTAQSLLPLVRGEAETVRDRLLIAGDGAQRAIVTPAWYLRSAEKLELFAQPDDLWHVNNVADRCCDVADSLAALIPPYEQSLRTGQSAELTPLGDILKNGLE
jgi:arylsulfatase A-like enzyme